MNKYLRRERPARGKLMAVTALVAFLVFIDLISGGKVRAQARAGGALVASGASKVESVVFGGFFSSRTSLIAEKTSLSEELAQYEERAAGFDALRAENEQLRMMVNLAQTSEGVTAPVVSSVRASPYGTFVIGAGSAERIARGNIVVTPGGFVVGSVSDVGTHTSLVAETFAPDASVEAIVGTASLQLAGYGGGNARAEVPPGLTLHVGQALFSPQVGQRAIGIVGRIASSSSSAADEIFVRLPVNLVSLQYVYVLR